MIGFMPFRFFDKYLNNYVHSYQQMDPICCRKYQSCFFRAPKNEASLGTLGFIT